MRIDQKPTSERVWLKSGRRATMGGSAIAQCGNGVLRNWGAERRACSGTLSAPGHNAGLTRALPQEYERRGTQAATRCGIGVLREQVGRVVECKK